jgi:chaperonin GroES
MRPLGNRVVVCPNEEERTTKSGLVLPSTMTENIQKGTVIAVGRGAATMSGDLIPMEVQVGDTVLFSKHKGIEMTGPEGEKVLLFHETDLFCIL